MKKTVRILFYFLLIIAITGCLTLPKEKVFEINNYNLQKSWYQPKPGISWQWQLQGEINTSYEVELYDIDLEDTPQTMIDLLHSRNIKVICYFSAGSWEDYRDDAGEFPNEVLGKMVKNWPDERWLDISNYQKFSEIIKGRLNLAVQKKCDGVEPDNIGGYKNENGFSLTYQDQINYNRWLAEQAHKRGLAIALKNDLDQVNDLVDYYDFAINEQCFYYNECNLLLPFIEQGKAVLGVEYELKPKEFCGKANNLKFSWLRMNYNLDGGRVSC